MCELLHKSPHIETKSFVTVSDKNSLSFIAVSDMDSLQPSEHQKTVLQNELSSLPPSTTVSIATHGTAGSIALSLEQNMADMSELI